MIIAKQSLAVKIRKALSVFSIAATASVCAAIDPVAEGFPAWEGLDADNRICGRELCPSDLRHKVVVVAEIEPTDEKAAIAQMTAVAKIIPLDATYGLLNGAVPWERKVIPHGVSVVVVNCGGKNGADLIKNVLMRKRGEVDVGIVRMNAMKMPVYNNGVTFAGAPQAPGGKRPFVYVMGPEGTEPLFSGTLDAKGVAGIISVVKKAVSSLPKWRQFYGSIEKVQHFMKFNQVLDPKKPQPLTSVMPEIKKGILSKKPDVANEAQILFDAVEQARSELVHMISMEAAACPHRALYDLSLHSKYFPHDKEGVSAYAEKLKSNSDAAALAGVLRDILAWSDPEFECKNKGEAKKIVTKLNALKKNVEKLKGSKSVPVQNGAYLLSGEIDQLIENIPMKVAPK